MGASYEHGALAGGTAAALQVVVGSASGLYRGRWRLASFDEAVALTGVVIIVTVALAIASVVASALAITLAISMLSPFVALCCMVVSRGIRRIALDHRRRASTLAEQQPVIVFGAGDGGAQIVRAMLGNARSTYRPVAILDDDPAKQNLRIQGVRVVGTRAALRSVAARTKSTVSCSIAASKYC